MTQNRDAPAFQEYAAAILARLAFRTMTLQDRGLLFTMRLECWVNVRLPSNHNHLAKVLGLPVDEVAESLAAVMPFFEIVDGFITSPELENYRSYLAERKIKQSQGGKLGSAITNRKRNSQAETQSDGVSSSSRVARQGTRVSLVQPNTKQQSQNQPTGNGEIADPFVAAYEAAECVTAGDYAKASRGG